MDILSLAVLLGTAVFLMIRRVSFSTVAVPVIFSWVLFALVTAAEWFPRIWNTGVTVTEENRERVYAALLHLITSTKLLITAYFSGMALVEDVPFWCVLAAFALILADLVYWFTRLKKAK